MSENPPIKKYQDKGAEYRTPPTPPMPQMPGYNSPTAPSPDRAPRWDSPRKQYGPPARDPRPRPGNAP